MAATQDYPSTQSLATYLDENYGASLSTHITTKGQSHIINVATSFVNDAYFTITRTSSGKTVTINKSAALQEEIPQTVRNTM